MRGILLSLALVGALAGCTRVPSQGGGGGDGGEAVASYKHYRLRIVAHGGDTYMGVAEFQLYSAVNGTNLALAGTATASSELNSSNGAADAVDGNTDTRWLAASTDAGEWVAVELPAAAALYSYKVASDFDPPRAPTAWMLEGSNDGATWETVDEQSSVIDWAAEEIREYILTPDQAGTPGSEFTHYRLLITDGDDSAYVGTHTLELHELVGGADVVGGGTATANNELGAGYVAGYAFDSNAGTGWLADITSGFPAWAAYEFAAPVAILEYVVGANHQSFDFAARSPKAWKLQGSNDGVQWYTLDEQVGVTWSLHTETQTFTID